MSFDAWLLEPQLPDVIDLAKAFPDTTIVLDHVGTPLGLGGYAGKRQERFGIWRDNIRALAALPNVSVKVGGTAMRCSPASDSYMATRRLRLGAAWPRSGGYVDACIQAFGPRRCMFESNASRSTARNVRIRRAVEHLQDPGGWLFGGRKDRPVQRHRPPGLSAGHLAIAARHSRRNSCTTRN